jgi:hypothetical protein
MSGRPFADMPILRQILGFASNMVVAWTRIEEQLWFSISGPRTATIRMGFSILPSGFSTASAVIRI